MLVLLKGVWKTLVAWLKGAWATLTFCWKEKFLAILVFWIVASATYILIPKFPVFGAQTTSFYPLDQKIPLLSWTIVFYLLLYVEVIMVFMLARNRVVLRNLFGAYMLGAALLSFFYFFMPTTHNYPAPMERCRNHFDQAVVWLRATDVAANQFPSGHALFSLLGPFLLISTGRYWTGVPMLIWGSLIAASTLTVKQHNLVDVVFGVIFALALGYLFGLSCPRKGKVPDFT